LIITSLSSMDMGSVGTSAAPILLTTCSTSGKLSSRTCSILVVISMVLLKEVPVFKTGWITKSPSSKVGTNSPLILLKIQMLRSEEHTSELQSRENLVCRLLLEKKKKKKINKYTIFYIIK